MSTSEQGRTKQPGGLYIYTSLKLCRGERSIGMPTNVILLLPDRLDRQPVCMEKRSVFWQSPFSLLFHSTVCVCLPFQRLWNEMGSSSTLRRTFVFCQRKPTGGSKTKQVHFHGNVLFNSLGWAENVSIVSSPLCQIRPKWKWAVGDRVFKMCAIPSNLREIWAGNITFLIIHSKKHERIKVL